MMVTNIITGGCTASMLANENPESIVNVAPCEGSQIDVFSLVH